MKRALSACVGMYTCAVQPRSIVHSPVGSGCARKLSSSSSAAPLSVGASHETRCSCQRERHAPSPSTTASPAGDSLTAGAGTAWVRFSTGAVEHIRLAAVTLARSSAAAHSPTCRAISRVHFHFGARVRRRARPLDLLQSPIPTPPLPPEPAATPPLPLAAAVRLAWCESSLADSSPRTRLLRSPSPAPTAVPLPAPAAAGEGAPARATPPTGNDNAAGGDPLGTTATGSGASIGTTLSRSGALLNRAPRRIPMLCERILGAFAPPLAPTNSRE